MLTLQYVTIDMLLWSKAVEHHAVGLHFSIHIPLSTANLLMLPDVIDNSFGRRDANVLERAFNYSWLVSHVEQNHCKVTIFQWPCPHFFVSTLTFCNNMPLNTC